MTCMAPYPDDQPPIQRLCRRPAGHEPPHRDLPDGAIERHGTTAQWEDQ